MVSSAGGSRPASLSQEQVDDLMRGNREVARALRSKRKEAPDGEGLVDLGTRPVDLSEKDIEAILRSGIASTRLAKRMAAAARPQELAPRKGKPSRTTGKSASSPTAQPPHIEGAG